MSKEDLEEKIALLAEQQGSQSSVALAELLKDVISYVDGQVSEAESKIPTDTVTSGELETALSTCATKTELAKAEEGNNVLRLIVDKPGDNWALFDLVYRSNGSTVVNKNFEEGDTMTNAEWLDFISELDSDISEGVITYVIGLPNVEERTVTGPWVVGVDHSDADILVRGRFDSAEEPLNYYFQLSAHFNEGTVPEIEIMFSDDWSE